MLFAGRLSVLGGLYGLDSEFDVIHAASLFLHSSHGTGPDLSQSGPNGPSIFPFTSLGLRLKLVPCAPLALQLAVLEGVPGLPNEPGVVRIRLSPEDGLLIAAEAAYLFWRRSTVDPRQELRRHASRRAGVPFLARVAVGAWTYTETFDDLTAIEDSGRPLQRAGSRGAYALAEGQVFCEAADPAQGLVLHARAGVASERVNRFGAYTGAGAVYTGLVAGRSVDRLGLGIATAYNGDAYKAKRRRSGEAVEAAEVNIELTYQASMTTWLSVQGDAQYIVNPNTDPALADAVVIAVRVLVAP